VSRPLLRSAGAEALGDFVLVFAIVGSGIAVQRLSPDGALRLFVNAVVSGAGLGVAIWLAAPVSGAHLNPAVTLVALIKRTVSAPTALAYLTAQLLGSLMGAITANFVFQISILGPSTSHRASLRNDLSELIVTALLVLIVLSMEGRATAPAAVGTFIAAAIVFSPSTAFANPAVTVARMLSDSYTGIAPAAVLPFIGAQLLGALLGSALWSHLLEPRERAGVR
jgi:glycerol uptake facilitator-like aquaporin